MLCTKQERPDALRITKGVLCIDRSSRKSSGEAILGSGLVFFLDWGYDTHQNKIIEIHVSKATYINKDYT